MTGRLLIAAVLFSGACMGGKDRFVAVEADFRRSVPLGMKSEEVARALDSMGIAHSAFKADSGRMQAIVRSVGKNMVTRTDAQFELLFDSTRKLTRINAKRILTGP